MEKVMKLDLDFQRLAKEAGVSLDSYAEDLLWEANNYIKCRDAPKTKNLMSIYDRAANHATELARLLEDHSAEARYAVYRPVEAVANAKSLTSALRAMAKSARAKAIYLRSKKDHRNGRPLNIALHTLIMGVTRIFVSAGGRREGASCYCDGQYQRPLLMMTCELLRQTDEKDIVMIMGGLRKAIQNFVARSKKEPAIQRWISSKERLADLYELVWRRALLRPSKPMLMLERENILRRLDKLSRKLKPMSTLKRGDISRLLDELSKLAALKKQSLSAPGNGSV